jgi:uncharacterized membrane protein (DUF2068 family)
VQRTNRMLQDSARPPIGLRLIAAYKLAKALLVFVLATVVLRLDPAAAAARVVRLAARLRLDPESHLLHGGLARLSGVQPRQLEAVGAGLILYGLLFVLEGVGLFLGKRWAEYLVLLTTGFLIPFEAFEVAKKASPIRVSVLLANVAVVVYLVRILRAGRMHGRAAHGHGHPDSGTK